MRFIILLFLFLASCSDSLIYNKATQPISIELQIASDTVLTGDSVKFRVKINPSIDEHIKRVHWMLNATQFKRWAIDTAFAQSGTYNATFHLVDDLDDSISTKQITITVAHKPECNSICYDLSTETFKWECSYKDSDDLTYFFSYTDLNDKKPITRTLDTNFWEPDITDFIVPSEGWTTSVIAENSFKIKSDIIKGSELCP